MSTSGTEEKTSIHLNETEENVPMRLVDLVTCPECKKTYVQKNVYRHLWEQHGWAREDCRLLVSLIKTGKKKLTTVLQSETYACGKCNVVYYSRHQLESHMKICLTEKQKTEEALANIQQLRAERLKFSDRFRSTSIHCPVCQLVCGTQECFVKHCAKTHATEAQPYTLEDQTFKDIDSFKVWFDRRQEDTCTSLTKRTGHAGETFYRCHMVGKYASVATKRKSNTRKLDQSCTAHLKVFEQADGTVYAMGCFSHIGHELNHKLLWLTETQERYIRELIDYGMTADQIYYHIKEQYEHYECKLKYISKNDIRNISVRYKKEQEGVTKSDTPRVNRPHVDYNSQMQLRENRGERNDDQFPNKEPQVHHDGSPDEEASEDPTSSKRARTETEEEEIDVGEISDVKIEDNMDEQDADGEELDVTNVDEEIEVVDGPEKPSSSLKKTSS